jgi:hypothetical protein
VWEGAVVKGEAIVMGEWVVASWLPSRRATTLYTWTTVCMAWGVGWRRPMESARVKVGRARAGGGRRGTGAAERGLSGSPPIDSSLLGSETLGGGGRPWLAAACSSAHRCLLAAPRLAALSSLLEDAIYGGGGGGVTVVNGETIGG